jgi:hypothetical protein
MIHVMSRKLASDLGCSNVLTFMLLVLTCSAYIKTCSARLRGFNFTLYLYLYSSPCFDVVLVGGWQAYIYSGICLNSGGIPESLPPKIPEYKETSSGYYVMTSSIFSKTPPIFFLKSLQPTKVVQTISIITSLIFIIASSSIPQQHSLL